MDKHEKSGTRNTRKKTNHSVTKTHQTKE